jgi:hypothetical protein
VVEGATKATSIPISQEEKLVPRKKRSSIDPYAAQGLNTGGLRLYPELEISAFTTSNVAKSATKRNADIGLELKPTLRFESQWSRHSWTGSASADVLRYGKSADLSTLTGSAETAFRLDIRRTTHADFTASYILNQSGSENSQVPSSAASPRRDHNFKTSAALTHDFGGVEAIAKLALSRSLYEDVALVGGGIENNTDRNYWEPTLSLRGSFGQNNAPLRPFIEAAYNPRYHDQKLDRHNQDRNSQGLSLTAGVTIAEGPLWTGEVGATLLHRTYADGALAAETTFGVSGHLQWKPTELTTIDATSDISQSETSTTNISAIPSWNAGLTLTQSLRENLDVVAGANIGLQSQSTGTDTTTSAKLGLNYKLNPNVVAGVSYQGTWFNSAAAGSDYNDQRLMTSVILRP